MKTMLRSTLLALAVLPSLAFASEHEGEHKGDHPYKEITAEELVTLQKETPAPVVIDARGGKYYDGEVIKGAVHLDAESTNAESLAKVIPSKDAKVVFYCSNVQCPASKMSAHVAHKEGYKNLFKFPGGIEEWKKKGLPTEKLAN